MIYDTRPGHKFNLLWNDGEECKSARGFGSLDVTRFCLNEVAKSNNDGYLLERYGVKDSKISAATVPIYCI